MGWGRSPTVRPRCGGAEFGGCLILRGVFASCQLKEGNNLAPPRSFGALGVGVSLATPVHLMSRLAIVSDVHADVHALRDALAQIERLGCDAVVCAGDLVDYGLF